MPFFPDLPTWENATINTTTFLGLNRGLSISDGEMADMLNMTSDNYPVLSTRRPRKEPSFDFSADVITRHGGDVVGMLGTDRLIVCVRDHNKEEVGVYMDGLKQPLTLSAEEHMQPKHLVSMGAYVCIWPDKKYFNVTNATDYGDMGSLWKAKDGDTITAMMCRKDGTDYDMESITVSDKAPEEPEDQQFWLDTSGDNAVLKQYSAMYQQWVQVATTYIKIQAPGIGKGLKEGDVPHLSGVRAMSDAAAIADGDVETLTFTAEDFSLYSSFTTTHQGGTNWVSTTASTKTNTVTFNVEGIPDGATVKSAKLTFAPSNSAYGSKQLTVNGIKCYEGRENVIDVEVTGNGEVNCKFVFQSNNTSSVSGSHGGTVNFRGITLTVEYAADGNAEMGDADKKQFEALNTTNIIYGCGDDYIIVAGLLHNVHTLANSLVAEMKIPDLDYICEANNRLWGCSYAALDGTLTNEIRCCALGDFRNWYRFEGTSMDSYVMSVGSDGPFTGAYSLQGLPLIWKEGYLHKISGTQPSNFTLNTIRCRGVQEGSWRSLAAVNEVLLYKSRNDVMAYDGAAPYSVGEKLGNERYYEAVGGAYRDKYYISMRNDDMVYGTYVFDTAKGLWHKEDESYIMGMANVAGDLVMAVREYGILSTLYTIGGERDAGETFDWSVTFGTFGFAYERAKYLSRFNVRAQMAAGSEMTFEIQYDSDGVWRDMGTMRSKTIRTFTLPIIPRRCDHCQVRVRGKGAVSIYSISRVFEEGGN